MKSVDDAGDSAILWVFSTFTYLDIPQLNPAHKLEALSKELYVKESFETLFDDSRMILAFFSKGLTAGRIGDILEENGVKLIPFEPSRR